MELDESILFMAFRYALTRNTYLVMDISQELIKNWDDFSKRYQTMIHKEIKEDITQGRVASNVTNLKEWEKVLDLPIKHS